MEDIVAGRTMGMIGEVADRIRNPVTVIGGLCKQLSKKKWKEFLKINLKISCLSAKKMEKIVADFDELVRSKRFLFKREDFNEIAYSTIRLVEQEIKTRISDFLLIYTISPLMFNANRQLIKIANGHVISSGIDATTPGGQITIFIGFKRR